MEGTMASLSEYLGICSLCSVKIPVKKTAWTERTSVIAGKGKWICGACLYKLSDKVDRAIIARNRAIKKSKKNDMKEYGVVMDSTTGKLVKIEPERKL